MPVKFPKGRMYGGLESWKGKGANSYGQLGLGHKEDVLLPQKLKDFCKPGHIKKITGGGGHSAVVTDGGGLFVCGLNKDGQLGLGHTEDVLYFTLCKSLLGCPVQQVACGWDFTIMLTEGGQVLSCGSNLFGQLGIPHGPRRCVVPQIIELLREKVVWVAAGLRHALAATVSGIVFQWGTGLASSARRLCPGQALPSFLTAKEPSRVTDLESSKATCVLAGSDHSASLTDAGELYVWGRNKHGQLATQAAFLLLPQKIEAHWFQNEKVTAVWSGWTHLVAQTESGKVFTWGRADYGQLGRKLGSNGGQKPEKQDSSLSCFRSQNNTPSPLHCLTGAAEISCGSEHNLAVIGGACYSWGWNEHGMCGDGSEVNVLTPKPVQVLPSAAGLLVGCGSGHSLALCQLPAHSTLGQDYKVTHVSPDATEDTNSQEAVDQEGSCKERQSGSPPQSQPDRSRNGGL
ncbi:secretion-regulating guanine nucleotide exchange factor isoform X2 [Dipodomys spectabilis]|uniref:secretion-regulating guanine nucleotide exchange factor isoform X2 n=1 Tax=Dipodomys spectabilis TaxID=105255 RepID=UPI001C53E94F|nr:secretion-regulating guanine nucleotide exchange factor isoform X2 [Dipodomys spectabilis]